MVNRVVLVGRLVKTMDLKKSETSDMAYAFFTLAVDNRVKDSNGERGTLFIDCRIFGNQAENMYKNTRKGSKIAVDGSLNQRNFTRQDGSKGKVIEVYVDSVTFLDPNPNRESNAVETPRFDDAPAPINGSNLDSIDLPDDDLPF